MENKLLTLLESDATLTPEQIAKMLEKEVGDIKKSKALFSATRPLLTGTRRLANTLPLLLRLKQLLSPSVDLIGSPKKSIIIPRLRACTSFLVDLTLQL